MTATTPPVEAPRRRLHPLSPLLHGVKTLAVAVAAISWQGYAQLGPLRWAALVAALCVIGLAVAAVSWRATGYQVTGRELRVSEGLVWRRTRAIPLERLQTVEVRQSPLARLLGVAELRLEVAGGSKTEAPLAYLGREDAAALRETLLGRARPPAPHGPAVAAVPLLAVPSRDVLVGQLLTVQALTLPLPLAFIVAQTMYAGSGSLIAFASTVTALVGVALQPVRRVLADWSFRLSSDADGLHVARGLLELRRQVVPVRRVQIARAVWPLLWRRRGWLRIQLEIAGVRQADEEETANTLMPVGDLATARRLLPTVLPGVDLLGLPMRPAPPRARWLAPLAQPTLAVAVTDEVFATADGVFTRRYNLVPYARAQSVRLTRSRTQRLLGLASVHLDTGAGTVTAAHRDADEARWLAGLLTDRMLRALR
ncbi:hypothetical protein GCM10010201_21950 [Pilimelia columellifera subsp. columellifera]|uniref:YdbS-like PH domain-containing protein n=1 Tax=Pilimelia columellifera subsp. columellifera TaxID=706583 RepID=A0ABP6ATR9_9ACTN